MTQTVLVAGATGMLGSRVAHHLLEQPDARVRLLVRNAAAKEAQLAPLVKRGGEVVEGSLTDPDALERATSGVDVIVSTLQGGPDVMIGGQVALAAAGKRSGVRRIVPSDFALDLFKATPGEHPLFDLRRAADEQIVATGLEQVNILMGGFMNLFLPGGGAIDLTAGTVTFWGDGTQPIEVTTAQDTARMVARVALDKGVKAANSPLPET